MNKQEELQKWLDDDRYVQRKELEKLWGVSRSPVRGALRRHNIKPVKKLHFRDKGMVVFYDRAECERARPLDEKKESQKWMDDNKYVRPKELTELWGLSASNVSRFFLEHNIKPVKKFHLGRGIGSRTFYDRAECERARPFINQPETKEVEIAMQQDDNNQPDIIPADTIDSYTLKQLESELQNRGVEFTPVTAEIIKGSDMPEFKQIAKMLDGEADSIILSGVKLGEVASFLEKSECVASILQKTEKPKVIPVDFFSINGDAGVFYLNKELKNCPFCGSDSVEVSCEKPTPVYWVAKIYCNGCEITTDNDGGTMESAAEVLIDFWNRRVSSESSVELQKTSGIDSTAIKSQISRIEQELISLKNMLS